MPPFEQTLSMANDLHPRFEDVEIDEQAVGHGLSAAAPAADQSWQRLVDRLIEWWKLAGSIDPDGFQFPSRRAVQETAGWLTKFQAKNFVPQRVVAAGDGGITIEFVSSPAISASLEIDECGQSEYLLFSNCELVMRQPVQRPSDPALAKLV